jgi:hypothetical protein
MAMIMGSRHNDSTAVSQSDNRPADDGSKPFWIDRDPPQAVEGAASALRSLARRLRLPGARSPL